MTTRRSKTIWFVLEGLNSFAATFYFNYLFFFLRDNFGFNSRQNLWMSALHGLIYTFAAWQGGRFGQRRGYFAALKLGWAGAAAAMLVGAIFRGSLMAQYVTVIGYTAFICFTWPALEALISHGASERELPRLVGIYNVVWAGAAALAYFFGGAVFEKLGWQTLFWLPAILFAGQCATVFWLERDEAKISPSAHAAHKPEAAAVQGGISPQTFLKMAWLGNPVGYIAGNTVIAAIPAVAQQFNLSVTASGLFCSLWMFTRLAAFVVLWRWTKWHYRFGWLVAAFVTLTASFAALLLAHELWLLVLAQIGFGAAVGLLYYSSLFYAMDVGGESQGDHGGLHEAFIGLGIFAGTATGAVALQFFPATANAGTYAVGGLLVSGLGGLFWLRRKN
ncbi:MAG: hypothetical protein RLZZ350_1665 [Verrucomicrobiota bacterium]|jgi:predicted MFS family arabinose efflux permease